MNENTPSRPKLSGSLAASLRSRSASTPSTAARALPSLPVNSPATAPVTQTPSVPRAAVTPAARSLPAIPVQKTAPVITQKQPVPAPVAQVAKSKANTNRSAAAKKRNRGPVITPRDMALLKFLCKVNIATPVLIAKALTKFEYKDVRTGELKPASVDGIKARLTVLRKEGLVDYKNNRNGVTGWIPTWDGYEVAGMPFPDNRPRHARTTEAPKPQKARVAPKQSKWAHLLGLAALIIHYKQKGYRFITDDAMLSASEEMRALNKNSNGYISNSEIRNDLSFKNLDRFEECADHFTFPNSEGGSHRPDLVVLGPEGVTAVELELHRKNIRILMAIFVGYALSIQSKRFDSVVYVRPPHMTAFLDRYLEECAIQHPNLREFLEKIRFQTYNAEEWDAAVPEM